MIAWHIARQKPAAKQLMRELGLPTPDAHIVPPGDDPIPAARAIGWPCVVKPIDRGSGKGVATGLRNQADLLRAVQVARTFSRNVMVEAHLPGDDHRLLVVDGRLVAAARRLPPTLEGDGRTRLHELVARFNAARGAEPYLKPVNQDEAMAATLAQQGLAMDSVVERGRKFCSDPMRTGPPAVPRTTSWTGFIPTFVPWRKKLRRRLAFEPPASIMSLQTLEGAPGNRAAAS